MKKRKVIWNCRRVLPPTEKGWLGMRQAQVRSHAAQQQRVVRWQARMATKTGVGGWLGWGEGGWSGKGKPINAGTGSGTAAMGMPTGAVCPSARHRYKCWPGQGCGNPRVGWAGGAIAPSTHATVGGAVQNPPWAGGGAWAWARCVRQPNPMEMLAQTPQVVTSGFRAWRHAVIE